MSELEKALLRTIVYFDVLDMAPTVQEIWRNLLIWSTDNKPSLGAILTGLDSLKNEGFIGQKLEF